MPKANRTPVVQVQLKLRLTKAQARQLDRWLWHLTGVYNWALGVCERERLSRFDLKRRLNGHSQKLGINAWALGGTAETAHGAWARCRSGLSRRPRRKSARRPLRSIAFDHGMSVRGSRLSVPGVGLLRFHRQDIPVGPCGYARIVKRASGWYACLFIKAEPRRIQRVADNEVGIDPGFSSLLTLSTGEKLDPASEWASTEQRLGQAQRGRRKRLSTRLHERIANQRKNRNHHLSRRLVSEHRLIAFSADRHANIARRFGKSVASAGHAQLRSQLRYKSSLTGGTEYVEVDSRNSTRTCSACGGLTGPRGWHGLKVRAWRCGCGAEHDRDVNAALVTLQRALGAGTAHENGREVVSGIAS